ncbi:MAG TPA: LuxR C-terminal-related transcriptional regulator, partial [Streptosporangiaceae bacterium]|nr:LuxR C-terminal-related transcriptional regulator [Streptosporangiaceae bacterium]
DGQAATVHELLEGLPADAAADAELTALRAADELNRGSLEQAERYLALTGHRSVSVPEERRELLEVMRAVLRLRLARQGGDLPAVMEEAQRLLSPCEAGESRMNLRALALISLGAAELWSARLEDAQGHLEQGAALARRIGEHYLEINGRAHLALVTHFRSLPLSAKQSRQVIELARRHGCTDDPAVAIAYMVLGAATFWPGDLHEADLWFKRAEQALRAELEPAAGMLQHLLRGELEMALGHDAEALAVFQAAMPLTDLLATPCPLAAQMRARMVHAQLRLGDTARADAALAGMDPRDRESLEMRIVLAELRLAQGNPEAATAALAPILGSSAPGTDSQGSATHASPVQAIAVGGFGDTADALGWVVQAWLAESVACKALGDTAAAEYAAERALSFADSGDVLVPFLLHRAPELLKRHARHCSAHAALIATILDMLTQAPGEHGESSRGGSTPSVSDAEIRVLRYLPSDLTVPEIARQLSLSVNTVRTHMRHIYDKLHTHRRRDVVERASALGLLSSR